jgi:hypothetical protein
MADRASAAAAAGESLLCDHCACAGTWDRDEFAEINPIKALFWSAVLNGVVSVPVMAAIMTAIMAAAVAGMGVTAIG